MTARVILIVVGLAIAVSIFMAPRRDEQLAMAADEARKAELIFMIQQQLAADPKNPTLIASLSRAYEAAGNYWQAALSLDRYTSFRPTETEALIKLADLDQRIGDEKGRIVALERLFAIASTLANAVALAESYDQSGRMDSARALLAGFADDKTIDRVLMAQPLLGARLALYGQNLPLARMLFDRVDVSRLGASDPEVWFDLLKALAEPPTVLQVLEAERRKGNLPRVLLLEYSILAGNYGQDVNHNTALAEAGHLRQ